MFRNPGFSETFRVIPVHFRIIGTEEDPEHPNRPRMLFAGEVRDGQTMVGRVEMTPDKHLRWKWVRSRFIMISVPCCSLKFPWTYLSGMRRVWSGPLEVRPLTFSRPR